MIVSSEIWQKPVSNSWWWNTVFEKYYQESLSLDPCSTVTVVNQEDGDLDTHDLLESSCPQTHEHACLQDDLEIKIATFNGELVKAITANPCEHMPNLL